MSKSKFSKRQIAGTLLLSSTAIGATASSTVSANRFKDLMKNTKGYLGSKADALWQGTKGVSSTAGNYAVSTMDKVGEILKSGVNKIGDLASNSYNKVAESKFGEYVGKGASYIGNKASNAYNLVKDSKVGDAAGAVKSGAGKAFNWVKDSKGGKFIGNVVGTVGNFVSDHAWGVAAVGLFSVLLYGTFRAINAGINCYSNKEITPS